ncbi:MAG: amidohydrolase family protein [Saprospiraceae bacterium]|nr:amidohydrolase family protein [Saprospiraceae bacterium]MDW8228491.1 amidohydrolase family protein [Saprospiraceae bacterium]
MKFSLSRLHLLLALFWAALASAQTRYVHCGRLFTMTDERVLTQMTIVVEGDRIVRLEAGYSRPSAGAEIVDWKNYTVLPGLIDCHVHIESEQSRTTYSDRYTLNDTESAIRGVVYAERTLRAGFTTVRDLGGRGANIAIRNAVQQGWIPGPRILTAGKSISITGGHGDYTTGARSDLFDPPPGVEDGIANGPDACRAAVRHQVRRGADLIKVTATGGVLSLARDGRLPHYAEDELVAIVRTAQDLGVRVAAHAHGDEGARRAIAAGVHSIEHGTFMSDQTIAQMKAAGTWYVPTLTAGWAVSDSARRAQGFFPEVVRRKAFDIGPTVMETLGRAYRAGVNIAFGTDAGVFPHGKNALEFHYMAQAGMKPWDILRAATVNAAQLLGLENEIGRIAPGFAADLVAVPENPLDNIRAFERVAAVMRAGKVFTNE